MTDEAGQYAHLDSDFTEHDFVQHCAGEYGYTDRETGENININTVEGFYSMFKRGMKGIYQHCGEQHFHRYLAEFDFRYYNRVQLGVDDASAPTVRLKASSASVSPIERLSEGRRRYGPKAKVKSQDEGTTKAVSLRRQSAIRAVRRGRSGARNRGSRGGIR